MIAYIKELSVGRRVLLIINAVLIAATIILYSTYGKQQVIRYEDSHLRFKQEGDVSTYTGRVNGKRTQITVKDSCEVVIRSGEDIWGPYTIVFDNSAIPPEEKISLNICDVSGLKGIEIFLENVSLFRGAYQKFADVIFLIDESGDMVSELITVTVDYDFKEAGEDSIQPDIETILKLAVHPDITQRGEFSLFSMGIFLSVVCILAILFEDELFRYSLRFQIRNAETAEPSEWEMYSRWLSWIMFTGLAVFADVLSMVAM